MIYEVFRQERKGQAFAHAGSVEAPNEEFAEAYAREQYGRRGESTALWVVPREAVGDRNPAAHEANLYDIDAKYGDVVSVDEVVEHLEEHAGAHAR